MVFRMNPSAEPELVRISTWLRPPLRRSVDTAVVHEDIGSAGRELQDRLRSVLREAQLRRTCM
jgi:hypothetical protein